MVVEVPRASINVCKIIATVSGVGIGLPSMAVAVVHGLLATEADIVVHILKLEEYSYCQLVTLCRVANIEVAD